MSVQSNGLLIYKYYDESEAIEEFALGLLVRNRFRGIAEPERATLICALSLPAPSPFVCTGEKTRKLLLVATDEIL